jgi:hypothetical protein
MLSTFLHTNQDLLPLLGRAFDQQDKLAFEAEDPELKMNIDEAMDEIDLFSTTRDTHLVDDCTHTHANIRRPIGEAKIVPRQKKGSNSRRQRKRQEKAANSYAPIHKLSSKRVLKHPIPTKISLLGMPIANGAYVGKRVESVDGVQDLQTLLDAGFQLVEWDGRCETGLFYARFFA